MKHTGYRMEPELKAAWDNVLFWAKRLSYHDAEQHPEWREKYNAAVARRDEIRSRLAKSVTAESA